VLLAKQLSSIDVLSGGRLVVGVGVGYVEAELAAFGVALPERAARTDEYLDVLLALWRHEQHHAGRFVTFDGVVQHPAPTQQPHPPVVVGGHARPALERAARVGDGWFGWGITPDDLAPVLARLHQARERLGGARLEITVAPPDPFLSAETAAAYADLGVDRLVLVPAEMTAATTDAVIDHAAEHLIEA
jgi:alkanesulfonate monooxygenase SsuD/methylene tetrahydromethanopterin reductase-like flavin-dependent oxidoreductase (luciferase family)